MNNGILTVYDNRVNNSFFSTNRSLTYSNYELGKNCTILGPQESTPPRNYSSGGGTRAVSSNHIGIPYINNGILNYNNEYSQNIDFDNSYVFVIDTASPSWSNAYYNPANEPTARIPHLMMGFGYRGIEPAIVNWGDGQFENLNTAFVNKTYRQHGIYIVQITPVGTNFGTAYNPALDARNDFRDGKVVGILSWPKRTTSLMTFQFWQRCDFVPPFIPTNVTSFSFAQATGPLQNIELWDVSRLTSIAVTYNNVFNRDLSKWVFNSGLTSLSFIGDSIFNNGESSGINNWNVSNFTSMSNMFNSCTRFNQPLSSWNTANVTNMTSMFYGATNFNQPLNTWDVAKVTDFSYMFQNTSSFNSSLSGWSLGTSTTASIPCVSMFQNSAFNQPINDWNVSRVTNMQQMFLGSSFNQPINNWNVSNVTNMQQMFQTSVFNQNLDNWNVSKVTNMSSMFLSSSFNGSVSGWIPGSGCNCSSTFQSSSFTGSGLDTWDATKLGNISSMFAYNNNASSIAPKIVNWNLCNSTNMTNLFFNVNMGNSNYDNILNSWSVAVTGNPVKNWATNLTPHFGNAKYTSAGSAARASLISYGWTITDGGAA